MSAVVTSVRGLQNLTNLQTFNADYNGFQTIDLSGMPSLAYVDVSDCDLQGVGQPSLTSVNLTDSTNIVDLRLNDSNFSTNNLSHIIGLSNLSNLEVFDIRQSGISGTIDMSNFPNLYSLNVAGNGQLTDTIITGSQPITYFNGNDCNFSQEVIDNVLTALSENGTTSGEVAINGAGMGIPSEIGVSAIRTLSANGWYIFPNSYSSVFNVTDTYPTEGEACTDLGNAIFSLGAFTYVDTNIQIGNYVYSDDLLVTPRADGWFGLQNDGKIYLVSGSGLIVSQSTCI